MTLCITASVGCMPGDVVYYCQCRDVCLVTLCLAASVGCMSGDVVYCCQCWMYAW